MDTPSVQDLVGALMVYHDYQPDGEALQAAALAAVGAAPDKLPEALEALRQATQRPKEVAYLRLIPIETPRFRHGISLSVHVDPRDKNQQNFARQVVAEYLHEWLNGHEADHGPTDWPETLWEGAEELEDDFSEIKVTTNRALSDQEALRLFSCIAYAFRQHLRGEDMGLPRRVSPNQWIASYDITKSVSENWQSHLPDALAAARLYAVEGTPPRKTQRGTRLIQGLGDIALDIQFH